MLASDAGVSVIASAVRNGSVSASEVARSVLERIAIHDPLLKSFTAVTAERAYPNCR